MLENAVHVVSAAQDELVLAAHRRQPVAGEVLAQLRGRQRLGVGGVLGAVPAHAAPVGRAAVARRAAGHALLGARAGCALAAPAAARHP